MLLQCRRVLPLIVLTNRTACWQRLWLSLYSGRFRFQRPAVRIHSSEKLYSEHLLSTLLKRQDENKEKEAGNGPFKKTRTAWLVFDTVRERERGINCLRKGLKQMQDIFSARNQEWHHHRRWCWRWSKSILNRFQSLLLYIRWLKVRQRSETFCQKCDQWPIL